MGNPYDWAHQQERRHWDRRLVTGGPISCRRCGLPVYPDRLKHLNHDGMKFDLGHPDPGQDSKAPEHGTCNRAAGGRSAQRQARQPASQEWW